MNGAVMLSAPKGVSLLAWASILAVPVVTLVMVQQGLYRQVPASFFHLLAIGAGFFALAAFATRKLSGVPVILTAGIAAIFIHYCGAASLVAFAAIGLSAMAIGTVFDPALNWSAGLRALAGLAVMALVIRGVLAGRVPPLADLIALTEGRKQTTGAFGGKTWR